MPEAAIVWDKPSRRQETTPISLPGDATTVITDRELAWSA